MSATKQFEKGISASQMMTTRPWRVIKKMEMDEVENAEDVFVKTEKKRSLLNWLIGWIKF